MTHTDYIALLCIEKQVGLAPAIFSLHGNGDKHLLLKQGRMASLFVLHGGIICTPTHGGSTVLSAGQMVVLNKPQMREIQCLGDTVILECVESERMSTLMQSTSNVFNMPVSESITMNNKLWRWCEQLLIDITDQTKHNNSYYHNRCSELTTMLLEYPKSSLGTLFIPLFACHSHCHTCSKQFIR